MHKIIMLQCSARSDDGRRRRLVCACARDDMSMTVTAKVASCTRSSCLSARSGDGPSGLSTQLDRHVCIKG